MKARRALAWAGIAWAVTAVLGLVAAALFLVAVWTSGPDSGRWAGTAGIVLVLFMTSLFTAICLAVE